MISNINLFYIIDIFVQIFADKTKKFEVIIYQFSSIQFSCSVMSDSVTLRTLACQAPLSMGILQARILEWVAMPSSKGSSQPKDQTRSPTFQAGSLLSEPPGKPTNTAVGSLYLLQGIFLTQELNQGLLHCRRILYS